MKFHYSYNYEICKECGGRCCKSLPGSYSPEDIKKLFPTKSLKDSVELALKTKTIAIDWWERVSAVNLYFLRPKVKGVDKLYDPTWGGECIHLTDKGCILDERHRPSFCKILIPSLTFSCKMTKNKANDYNPKLKSAILWEDTGLDLSCYWEFESKEE